MRVLVLSSRLTERRRAAIRTLAGDATDLVVVGPGAALPDPAGCDAILVDGPQPPRSSGDLLALREAVERGAGLVALGPVSEAPDGFWSDFLGVVAAPETPPGEYFARVTGAHSHLTTRVSEEFAVVDRFTPLAPVGPVRTLVQVRVALRDLAAVAELPRGAGRVLTSGLGNTDEALDSPELSRLLARALRRPAELTCCGHDLGVGIVGYGRLGGMGQYHGLGVGETPGLALAAVVDPDLERCKEAEAAFPGIRAYGSADELAADDEVEVVIVATPPAFHADLAVTLLRAGKHVACEKPLCLTVADADRIVAAARSHGRVLTVHQNRRWDPDFVALRRAVDSGLLGQLFNVETFVGGYAHPCRTWHSEVSLSGGAVYDWGAHHVDWILELLSGMPALVQTHGHKRVWHDVTNLDQLRVRMTWPDGREAEFFQSDVAAVRRPKFYVQGTRGTLVGHYRELAFERLLPGQGYVVERPHHAEAPAELTLARYESGYGLTETRLPSARLQPFAFHRNLADHLHLGEPLAVTPAAVRRVVAVLEAAQRSSDAGGRPVAPAGEPG